MFTIFGWKSTKKSARSDLLVFEYDSKRIMAKRQLSYHDAIETCRSLFPNLPPDSTITLNTKDLEICKNKMAEISEESWKNAIAQLDCVVVMAVEKDIRVTDGSDDYMNTTSISVIFTDVSFQKLEYIEVLPSLTIEKLLDICGAKIGLCVDDLIFIYHGHPLLRVQNATVQDYEFKNGDQIQCFRELLGRKPIIYLYSPTPIEATVKLSLAPQWDFSAIYPVVPIKPRTESSDEEVTWQVKVHSNGDLTELTTGLDVAYLFWEAHTNPTVARPATPPPTPGGLQLSTEDIDVFYPNDADLNDNDSVVLSTKNITPYLDKALSALCLHTEARTSFITYWLPSLLKHKHVAMRFASQKSYEHAAPLTISPTPDVVTRIFMVFRGIVDKELNEWSVATERASKDVIVWRDIVGIDFERAHDKTLFRVLEWGGMEVFGRSSS